MLFAQLVGSFCGLASALAPGKAQFRFDLSDLNVVMEQEAIPAALRFRLREYMHQTAHLRQAATRQRLFGLLSPGIGGELALKMNEKWLASVWFLPPPEESQDNRRLHLALARLLEAEVFAPGESCPPGRLYIVSKGRALYAGHVYKLGSSWGSDEALIEDATLRYRFHAIASGYLWTYTIAGAQLREVIKQHPGPAKLLRRFQTRRLMHRAVVRMAEEDLQSRGERSFHGRHTFLLARDPAELRQADRNARRQSFLDGARFLEGVAEMEASSLSSTPPRRMLSMNMGSMPGLALLQSRGSSFEGASAAEPLQGTIETLAKTQKEQAAKLEDLGTKVERMHKDMGDVLQLLKSHLPMSRAPEGAAGDGTGAAGSPSPATGTRVAGFGFEVARGPSRGGSGPSRGDSAYLA